MTESLARKHAEALLAEFAERSEAGYPLGVVNSYTDEWFSSMSEAMADTPEDEHDNLTEASGFDYLSDALDIHYVVNSDRSYRSARVLIGFGGPNVWIDTRAEMLEVYWGFDAVSLELPADFVSALDDALEELWDMGA